MPSPARTGGRPTTAQTTGIDGEPTILSTTGRGRQAGLRIRADHSRSHPPREFLAARLAAVPAPSG